MSKSEENLYAYEEEFRNNIATVDEEGKRIWVYPKKPSGPLHQWRILVTTLLLALLFGGPFITIKGQPLLLVNIFERKFIILGQVFWPQDFVILALLLITFFVFVILFTVVFGRIWCGWLCPQTLFMEMVFRKIEYWIEGDANEQRRLNRDPWTLQKITKKAGKHIIFITLSLLISHTVLAYIIGVENTFAIVQNSPAEHWAGFAGLMGFTGIFYFVFARFREQACIAVCPYGRLQGVLLSKDSIVVAYDWIRGEPRGKIKKNQPTTRGDCIDCKLCVHVCPTGIDIRNGTQLECVNCTACIDACDEVMIKIGKPKGLIRYASYNSIKEGISSLLNNRVVGYSFVLLILIGVLGFTLWSRTEVETTILKVPGTLYQKTDDGNITNLYNIEFVNKTFNPISVDLQIESPAEAELTKVDGSENLIPAEGMLKSIYFIKVPAQSVSSAKMNIVIGIYKDNRQIDKKKVRFIGPVKLKK